MMFEPVKGLSPICHNDPYHISPLGIKFSYFCSLKDHFQMSPEEASELTTADVCEKLIKPVTVQYGCSFCEYLECIDSSLVGNATVFVSHAWRFKFVAVVEAFLEFLLIIILVAIINMNWRQMWHEISDGGVRPSRM